MLKILSIPEQLVNAIGQMYENTRAKVTSPDGKQTSLSYWSVLLACVITQVTNIKNHVLICYTQPTYSDFFNCTHVFCYLGMFGQAGLWLSLADRAVKK